VIQKSKAYTTICRSSQELSGSSELICSANSYFNRH
jgi:hypothetical protein